MTNNMDIKVLHNNNVSVNVNLTGTPNEVFEKLCDLRQEYLEYIEDLYSTLNTIEVTGDNRHMMRQADVRRISGDKWDDVKTLLDSDDNVTLFDSKIKRIGKVYTGLQVTNHPGLLDGIMATTEITDQVEDVITLGLFKKLCRLTGHTPNDCVTIIFKSNQFINAKLVSLNNGLKLVTGVKLKRNTSQLKGLSNDIYKNNIIINNLDKNYLTNQLTN